MDGWMDGGGGSGWDDLIDRQTDRQTGRYGCDLVGPVLVTHFEDKLSIYVLIINRCGYEFIFILSKQHNHKSNRLWNQPTF